MAATTVLLSLLLDDQLSSDEVQDIFADDTGARFAGWLLESRSTAEDKLVVPPADDFRAAILAIAKKGYLNHSQSIKQSRLGACGKQQQPGAKQLPQAAASPAPPSPSAFPALPSAKRPSAHTTPTAATPANPSWASTAAAGAAAPTASHHGAPSPASCPPSTAAPSGGGGRLMGAWAQGPLGSMSQKKQAALDERMRGRTPPGGGAAAAGSPAASIGSTGSVQMCGGGRAGRNGGARQQQHTPPAAGLGCGPASEGATVHGGSSSGPGVAWGPNGGQSGGRGTANGGWGGAAGASSGTANGGWAGAAGASPGPANGNHHHLQSKPGPHQPQQQGGIKRIVPKPVQPPPASAGDQAVWPLPASAGPGAIPASGAVNGEQGVAPAVGFLGAWGVPMVQTSRHSRQQHERHMAGATAPSPGGATGLSALPGPDSAAADGGGDRGGDPITPCSAVATASAFSFGDGVAAGEGADAPGPITPCSSSLPAAAAAGDPVTPAAQIVPAVGSESHLNSALSSAYRVSGVGSPPSVTSYRKSRPPLALAGAAGHGRLPLVKESPLASAASGGEMAAGTGSAGLGLEEQGTAYREGPCGGKAVVALGPTWGGAHERLARLHACVLCAGQVACLQDELSELLYLLACPPEALLAPGACSDAGGAAAGPTPTAAAVVATGGKAAAARAAAVEWPMHVAVQYGCAVLSRCSGLLSGLGHKLLAAVATCAAARLAAPALAAAADAAAQRRERSLARSRAVDALGGQRLQLVGPMLQSGNDMASGKSRSQEQQRRISNRERCRDMFFAVIRQAASLVDGAPAGDGAAPSPAPPAAAGGLSSRAATPLLAHTPGQTCTQAVTAAYQGPGLGGAGAGAVYGGGPGASPADLLVPLRAQCLDVLHSLHPDNLPFFAELFTGCVLQAAATGESLVEGDLANLASRNPSKFQRLNQRMQQGPGQILPQSHSHAHPPQQSTPSGRGSRTPTGTFGDGGGLGPPGGPAGGSGRLQSGGGTPGPFSTTSSHGFGGTRGGGGHGFSGGGATGGSGAYGGGGCAANGAYGGSTPTGPHCGGGGGGGGGGCFAGTLGEGAGGGPPQRDTFGVMARCAAALQRLSYFPPPQRPYVFFLEATDSQSLLAAVSRHMASTLQSMLCKALGVPTTRGSHAPAAANGGAAATGLDPSPAAAVGPLGDHVVATGTLASYLAYLSVVHSAVRHGVALPAAMPRSKAADAHNSAGAPAIGRSLQPASQQHLQAPRQPPLDVLQLLCVAEERGVLVHVVPCVAQYLYFLTSGARMASGSGPEAPDGTLGADGGGSSADAAGLQLLYLEAVAEQLRLLLASRALQPRQPGFCAAALCLRSAAEEALSHATAMIAAASAAPEVPPTAGKAPAGVLDACSSSPLRLGQVLLDGARGPLSPGGRAEWDDARLARSLQESDGLVDARLLELCCPAIEAASRVLQRAAAAASKLHAQHQSTPAPVSGGGSAAAATASSPGSSTAGEARPIMPRRVPPAALVRLGSGAAAGGAAAAAIPTSVAAVLSAPGPSPLQQALAQALLGQYSTGEHAVPMRDVVSYVTGVLAVNGAAAALELIVPQVASEHLSRLAVSVRPVLEERVRRWQDDDQLAPFSSNPDSCTAAAASAPLPPPPLLPMSEAMAVVAALAESATAAATAASLEAALPAVRRQLRENALRSLQALLPGTVPEEAVAAAAALAAQSAEAACLQRLVAHVPTAVRNHMEEQVKHVVREVLREVERQAAEARLAPAADAATAAAEDAAADRAAEAGGAGASGGSATATSQPAGPADGPDAAEAVAPRGGVTGPAAPVPRAPAAVETTHTPAGVDAGPGGAVSEGAGSCDGAGGEGGGISPGIRNDPGEAEAAARKGSGSRCMGTAMGPENVGSKPGSCSRGVEAFDDAVQQRQQQQLQEENLWVAAKAGDRLAAALLELAGRAPEPQLDEVVQTTVRCVSKAVALRQPLPRMAMVAGGADASEWAACSAGAAATAAGQKLYDTIRGGDLDAGCLERLFVRCLRAACATAAAGGAAAAAWGARPPPAVTGMPPAAAKVAAAAPAAAPTASEIEAVGEADSGAAAFAFLAEVALVIVHCNANDAPSWADVVWTPPPPPALLPYEDETVDPDQEGSDAGAPGPAEAGGCSRATSPASSPSAAVSSGTEVLVAASESSASGEGTASSTSSSSSPSSLLPPMLANLYHHLAAYARDVESLRMLRGLRLALQRVTMGHLTCLDGGVRCSAVQQ